MKQARANAAVRSMRDVGIPKKSGRTIVEDQRLEAGDGHFYLERKCFVDFYVENGMPK
jgi:hypothetical protein